MAVLNINASRVDLNRIVDGVALNFGYVENIPDPDGGPGDTIPNPQSKDSFTEQKIIEVLRSWATSGEGQPEQQVVQRANRQRERDFKALDVTGT